MQAESLIRRLLGKARLRCHATGGTASANPASPFTVAEALMMYQRAVARVPRPLSEPLPLELQQRGWKVLEALNGVDGKDPLELAGRTVLAVLTAARPRFQGENELIFNDLCAAVIQWLKQEMKPLRFARLQEDAAEDGGALTPEGVDAIPLPGVECGMRARPCVVVPSA